MTLKVLIMFLVLIYYIEMVSRNKDSSVLFSKHSNTLKLLCQIVSNCLLDQYIYSEFGNQRTAIIPPFKFLKWLVQYMATILLMATNECRRVVLKMASFCEWLFVKYQIHCNASHSCNNAKIKESLTIGSMGICR